MKYSDYQENRQHGTKAFPVAYYLTGPGLPRYDMSPHWHKEFEIVRVLSGHFELFLDNVRHSLSAGDLLFISGGTIHHGLPENCVYECLVFDLGVLRVGKADAISDLLLPLIHKTAELNCTVQGDETLSATVDTLVSSMKNRAPYDALKICGLFYAVFYRLYETGMVQKCAEHGDKKAASVRRLIDWIDDHYTEEITLAKLAEISGFSEKYLCRVFKEYTSESPIHYLNGLRIEHACHALGSGTQSITDVAYNCGFNDSSYFCRLFKQYKGVSPQIYRKTALSPRQ